MRLYILFQLILITFSVSAQSQDEFEGVIRYRHQVYSHGSGKMDTIFKQQMGDSSTFYYKKGNYKWIIKGSEVTTEYFDDKTQTTYSLDGKADTLSMSVRNGYDQLLELFRIEENIDTICGLPCQELTTIVKDKEFPYSSTIRVLFYSTSIRLAPGRFSGYRTYASDKVYGRIKSWPLRISLSTTDSPVMLIMEAVEIIPRKLQDSEVLMPLDKPVRSMY